MGLATKRGIAVVTQPTRLEGLRSRFATTRQAQFWMGMAAAQERARRSPGQPAGTKTDGSALAEAAAPDATFSAYETEDAVYHRAVQTLERELDFGLPLKLVERSYVPNFDFDNCELVVVIGQDGLVANTAKYVGNLPIVAVNPDPRRFDGVLLPFLVPQARRAVGRVLEGRAQTRSVTLGEVLLNDGQRLLAFNDFFIGAASHVSARYLLRVGERQEPQSSSGVLVSTGAGSTGWFSSVVNMTRGLSAWMAGQVSPAAEEVNEGGAQHPEHGGQLKKPRRKQRAGREPSTDTPQDLRLDWEDRRLLWAVREPFISRHSRADLVAGTIDEGSELVLESLMPGGGVVFSDGVEADALQFNSGAIARIRAAEQTARLVME